MSYCCVPQCKGGGGYRFPKEKTLLAMWMIAIKRDNFCATPTSLVCPVHFKEDDFRCDTYNLIIFGTFDTLIIYV